MVNSGNDNPKACCGGPGPRHPEDGVGVGGSAATSNGKVEIKPELRIDDPDFQLVFRDGRWTIAWKWSGEKQPQRLQSRVSEYRCAQAEGVKGPYEVEVKSWISKGWLKK